jgi:hypothetical protein
MPFVFESVASIAPPPAIALLFSPAPLPDYYDGVAYSQEITFLNGTGPFFLLAGPPWMSISQVDSTHATVAGMPTGTGTTIVTFESTT